MKNALTSSTHFHATFFALLLLTAVLTAPAYSQWATDSTFNDPDWTSTVLTNISTPTAQCGFPSPPLPSCQCGQDTSNGNLLPSRKTCHFYSWPPYPAAIWVAHLYQPASSFYNPSTQGAIAGLRYSYDLIQYSAGGQRVTHGLLVYQNNTYYFSYRSNSPPTTETDQVSHSPNWQSFPLPSATPQILTAADFQEVSNTGSNKRPDFSCKGAPIQFGYVTGNSNTNPTISAVDNWKVDIIKGNPCCGAITKPEIRCNKGGGLTYTFEVANNSASQATQYLLLSPPPGAAYTVSPNVINTPLNPGQSTPVSVTVTNAAPNANVCVDVALADKEMKSCCKLTTCIPAPECPCLRRIKETVECGPGGSYIYTAQLQNQTGSPIQQIFAVPASPAGVTVTPQLFPVASGGTVTIQAAISGAPPGSQVCLRFAPVGAESQCCSTQVCFFVPRQGQC